MLTGPRKVKHGKQQKGRRLRKKMESRGTELTFGDFGLQAQGSAWISARQIEAARKAIIHCLKKNGRLIFRIFPDKPITKFPPEVTMGGGKGEVDHYVAVVHPGRILFEIDSPNQGLAIKALRLGKAKLSVKTKIIQREI